MSRRDRIDPETARLVEERLQWLLREHGPEPPPEPAQPPAERGRRAQHAEHTRAEYTGAEYTGAERPAREPEDPVAAPRRRRRPSRAPVRGLTAASDLAEDSAPIRSSIASPAAAVLSAAGSFRRPHLVIVGTIVALGILLAGWAVLRARPVAVAVTGTPAATSSKASDGPGGAGESGKPASPSPSEPPVVVHVLGAVKKPGLVTLPAGSRVEDALDAAGGLTGQADPGELNLAQLVADGQQIMVGTKGRPSGEVRDGTAGAGSSGGSGTGSGAGGGTGAPGQQVNLNSASQAQLEELPGVGPVMAGKIIAWRTEHGRFSRVEELQEIDGVGPKTYAKLAPLCRV